MKFTTTAGLVGFLLALSSVNIPKADATTNSARSSIESRLDRIAKVIREREKSNKTESFYIADTTLNSGSGGNRFLNYNSGFRNFNSTWGNNYSAWNNGGIFANGGNGFRNSNSGSNGFQNYNNSAGFRNSAPFSNYYSNPK